MEHDALDFSGIGKDPKDELRTFQQTAGTQLNASMAPNRLRWEGLTAANDNTPLQLEEEPRTFMAKRIA